MGTVEFKGFSSSDAASLTKSWGLKSGEVYDQSYVDQFFRTGARDVTSRIARERQSQGKPLPNFSTVLSPNRETLIVNLVIEMKN